MSIVFCALDDMTLDQPFGEVCIAVRAETRGRGRAGTCGARRDGSYSSTGSY